MAATSASDAENLLGRRYADLKFLPPFVGEAPLLERIVDQSYVSVPEMGLSLVLPDNATVGAAQLYSEGHEGFREYGGPLPAGLAFSMSRSEVRELLGPPSASGEEQEIFPLGLHPSWDRFKLPTVLLHVEYQLGRRGIRLITLTKG